VPIIPSPDKLTLPDISLVRQDLVDKARNNQLSHTELQGGTFSLSNFGSYGGDFETPILNPPQSALLGIGQITDEPVVRGGEIVIRPMMSISLTVDHRLIDGATAGKFRGRLKELLEKPALWLAALR
ncbi:MAG: 2-oxo acid dehydrogenase subunit E2, partial [Fimbriimonadaceae bacterium]|nr:2-oxo acid dehydrogenase subunit E2 [Alphaproteobacteria bacterium]